MSAPAIVVTTEQVNALLPQTQCAKCGYAGCAPYAEAISLGAAEINQCPPGGARGIERLAELTGCATKPLNPANGEESALRVAFIDEALCIGCTLCIEACPVDAIVGAAKRMTTVVAELCTGCDLCVPPCPMDCISMLPVMPARLWDDADASAARIRFESRQRRLAQQQKTRTAAQEHAGVEVEQSSAAADTATKRKRDIVAAAIERARQRRAGARSI